MVLGATLTAGSAVATPLPTNTSGAGAMGTITVGAAAKIGTYHLDIVAAGTDAGLFDGVAPADVATFLLTDPDRLRVAAGTVGTPFAHGGLSFTLASGSSNYAPGDGFNIAVTGTPKYVPYDDGNTDGSAIARAIALYPCDASGAEKTITGIVRLAEVVTDLLAWHASADSTAKGKAVVDLARSTIICRSV
jgi:hypothetical protein